MLVPVHQENRNQKDGNLLLTQGCQSEGQVQAWTRPPVPVTGARLTRPSAARAGRLFAPLAILSGKNILGG